MPTKRIFLSHSSPDKPLVDRLASDLERMNLGVWYDKWEIRVGDSLIDRISEGVEASDYLVIVLSPHSAGSDWVRRELNAALMRELDEKKVIVLPVKIDECEIPTLIREKKYANFAKGYEAGFEELLLAIFPECPNDALRSRDFRTAQYLLAGLAGTDYCGTNTLNATQLAKVYPHSVALHSFNGIEENKLLFWSAVGFRYANPQTPPFLSATVPVWGLSAAVPDEERAKWIIEGLAGPLMEYVVPFYDWAVQISTDNQCERLMNAMLHRVNVGDGVKLLPSPSPEASRLLYKWLAMHNPAIYESVFFPDLATNLEKLPLVVEGSAYLDHPPDDSFYFDHAGSERTTISSAVKALTILGRPSAVDLLRLKIDSATPPIELEVQDDSFRCFRDPMFVPRLHNWLESNPPVATRLRIVASLINSGETTLPVRDLVADAFDRDNQRSHPLAIRILGHGREGCMDLLQRFLKPRWSVHCEAAVFALARTCRDEAIEPLKRLLTSSSDIAVASCIEALSRLAGEESLAWISSFAGNENPIIRSAFYRAIQQIRPQQWKTLEAVGLHDKAPLVRLGAARAFAVVAKSEDLGSWLNDEELDPIVRLTADEALHTRDPFLPRWMSHPQDCDLGLGRLSIRLTNRDPEYVAICTELDQSRMFYEYALKRKID